MDHDKVFRAMALAAVLCGCGSPSQVGSGALTVIGDGVINDPQNKSLRFDILKFALQEFCEEVQNRGAPLKLREDQPVIGRFYADECHFDTFDQDNANSLVVQFGGRGFAWTNLTGRLGFRVRGLARFAPDFRVHEDSMYVYFRTEQAETSAFELSLVESGAAAEVASMSGVSPESVGRHLVDSQLRRGFTVIRNDSDGSTDFELGLVPLGREPYRPYTVVSTSKSTLANGRTEVHPNQQDFIGRFVVEDDDQALTITMKMDGAPAVDVFLVPDAAASPMIGRYTTTPGPAPLLGPPLTAATLGLRAPFQIEVPVPAGKYFLVIDHSGAAGPTTPTAPASPAKVDYLVQLGEAP